MCWVLCTLCRPGWGELSWFFLGINQLYWRKQWTASSGRIHCSTFLLNTNIEQTTNLNPVSFLNLTKYFFALLHSVSCFILKQGLVVVTQRNYEQNWGGELNEIISYIAISTCSHILEAMDPFPPLCPLSTHINQLKVKFVILAFDL